MASVTFPPSLGGDGSTVTDDGNPTTGLAQGGHRTRFVPALAQTVAMAGTSVSQATAAAGSASTATSAAATATTQSGIATTKAAEALTSANAAEVDADRARDAMLAAQGMVFDGWQGVLPITAQALHRSPNAVTAMCIYDTRLDSDGGAWTERCAHTSWYNEPLAGRWLGAHASESAARAVPGAATGDYFQRTTDGRFWGLNAGSGVTEVYRGNKRAFPRTVAILSSSAGSGSNVHVIYDLTEPGCPMWMVFKNTSTASANYLFTNNGIASALAINARNGIVALGSAIDTVTGGIILLDFPRDRGERISRSDWGGVLPAGLARRNDPILLVLTGRQVMRPVRSIDMTVMPGTPTDPQTGLPPPTVAIATGLGVYVIKSDGTIMSSALTNAFSSVSLDSRVLWAQRSDSATLYSAQNPAALGGNFTLTAHSATTPPDFNVGNAVAGRTDRRAQLGRAEAAALRVARPSLAAFGNSPAAKIAPTYNAGYLLGDIRRAYLAGAAAGAVGPAVEVVPQPLDFGVGGWALVGGPTVSGNSITTTGASGVSRVMLTVGRAYKVEWSATRTAGAGDISLRNGIASSAPLLVPVLTASGSGAAVYVATEEVVYIRVAAGSAWTVNSLSITEIVPDRSYKAAGASISGSLVATAAAANADLVGYSGWSASDYLREPYSADLDFGTGAWSVGAWIKIPAANAAAGVIVERRGATGPYITLGITAGNVITATAYDGTTTRTVTGSVAYNIDQWVSVRATYTADGALALHVNGRQVATTTGAPLLTLNNAEAVLTIGNSHALDAPFPGSIALLKLGATVPTAEQSAWIYEQERQLFREGSKCVLPDSGTLVDLAYDEQTDTWIAASAANVSEWSGLVRTKVTPTAGGNILKVAGGAGGKLVARTGVGVDIDLPGGSLRDELASVKQPRTESVTVFDFDATTSQTAFSLPTGYTARAVFVAGEQKREGSTKDWTRAYDGFVETINFALAPGDTAWVQVHAVEE